MSSQLGHLLVAVRLHYKTLCAEAALAAMHCGVWHNRLAKLEQPWLPDAPAMHDKAGMRMAGAAVPRTGLLLVSRRQPCPECHQMHTVKRIYRYMQ